MRPRWAAVCERLETGRLCSRRMSARPRFETSEEMAGFHRRCSRGSGSAIRLDRGESPLPETRAFSPNRPGTTRPRLKPLRRTTTETRASPRGRTPVAPSPQQHWLPNSELLPTRCPPHDLIARLLCSQFPYGVGLQGVVQLLPRPIIVVDLPQR